MWTYAQATGSLYAPDGELVACGYSGSGDGKNNPALQAVHDVGPIPCGDWRIGAPIDLQGGPHGPFVLPLTALHGTETFGRDGFLIHGDRIDAPGTASQGCVILPKPIRQQIAASGDVHFHVQESI